MQKRPRPWLQKKKAKTYDKLFTNIYTLIVKSKMVEFPIKKHRNADICKNNRVSYIFVIKSIISINLPIRAIQVLITER